MPSRPKAVSCSPLFLPSIDTPPSHLLFSFFPRRQHSNSQIGNKKDANNCLTTVTCTAAVQGGAT